MSAGDDTPAVAFDDVDEWPELLGYSVPQGASYPEKVYLRRQHVELVLEQRRANLARLHAVAEFAGMTADILEHVNEKTERRVVAIQQEIGEIDDLLRASEGSPELQDRLQTIIGSLQFQDIQRQELEAVRDSLRGIADFFATVVEISEDPMVNQIEMLPEVLEAMVPRTDIDSEDVTPEQAGPKVELF